VIFGGLFVFAVFLLGVAACVAASPLGGTGLLGEIFLAYVLLPGLGNLIGVWTMLTRKVSPWPLAGLAAGLALWSVIQASCFRRAIPPDPPAAYFFFGEALGVSLLLSICRLIGVELVHIFALLREPEPLRMQFTLRSLFSWTTAVALFLGSVFSMPPGSFEPFRELELVIHLGRGALMGVCLLWVALSVRSSNARFAVFAVVATATPCILSFVYREPLVLFSSPFFWLEGALVVGSFMLLRAAGYQLVWRGRVEL